jgi:hypothetical protein
MADIATPTYLTGFAVKVMLRAERHFDENLDCGGVKIRVMQFVGRFIDFNVALLDKGADCLYFIWFVATRVALNICVTCCEPLHSILLYGC